MVVQSRPEVPVEDFSTGFGFDPMALELSALHQTQDVSRLRSVYTPSESSAGGSVASPGRSEYQSTWPTTSSITDPHGAQSTDFAEESYFDMNSLGLPLDHLDPSVREATTPSHNDNHFDQEILLNSSQPRFQDASNQEIYNLELDPVVEHLMQAPGRTIAPRLIPLTRTSSFNETDANPAGTTTRPRGRRLGSLDSETRMNAGRMREVGSCVRCQRFKERCDEGQPCKKCLAVYGKMRTFKFPCSKEYFEDRAKFLLPDLLIGHLKLNDYIRQLPPNDAYIGDDFELSLMQNFQPPLRISVIEYPLTSDRNEAALVKDIFPIVSAVDRYEVYHQTTMSLPLRPCIVGEFKHLKEQIYRRVSGWMATTAKDDKAAWHLTYFPEEYGQAWPRAILETVCKFYHEALVKNCEPLNWALQATVIMYIQGHTFFIPPNDVPEVFRGLEQRIDVEKVPYYVCPSHVDGFLKTILYPVLKSYVTRLFKEIQNMYPQKPPCTLSRDEFLCTSIVLLILVATIQGKFIEKAFRSRREGKEIMDDALQHIKNVEEKVVQPLLDLWDFKFSVEDDQLTGQTPPERRAISDRARSFGLVEKLTELRSEHADEVETIESELPEGIDPQKFGAMNTTRLLKKFHTFIFKHRKTFADS